MHQLLKKVQEIYEASEQGNIGKMLILLGEDFVAFLPKALGGRYEGREGILEVVSKMCSSSHIIKKEAKEFVEIENGVIVLGKIEFPGILTEINTMPFVDIWRAVENKVTEVQVLYMDTEMLSDYLKEIEE